MVLVGHCPNIKCNYRRSTYRNAPMSKQPSTIQGFTLRRARRHLQSDSANRSQKGKNTKGRWFCSRLGGGWFDCLLGESTGRWEMTTKKTSKFTSMFRALYSELYLLPLFIGIVMFGNFYEPMNLTRVMGFFYQSFLLASGIQLMQPANFGILSKICFPLELVPGISKQHTTCFPKFFVKTFFGP